MHPWCTCTGALFFVLAEQYSIVSLYHSLLIHSPVEGHLGCFPGLGDYESSHCYYLHADFYMNISFHSPWVKPIGHFLSQDSCYYLESFCLNPRNPGELGTVLSSSWDVWALESGSSFRSLYNWHTLYRDREMNTMQRNKWVIGWGRSSEKKQGERAQGRSPTSGAVIKASS